MHCHVFVLVSLSLLVDCSFGFLTSLPTHCHSQQPTKRVSTSIANQPNIYYAAASSKEETGEEIPTKGEKILIEERCNDDNGVELMTMELTHHKPLGCTVEESLAQNDDKYVFVSKVVDESHAFQAGIQVGDVITGISGLFGEMECAIGIGIDKVKGFVKSRPEDEALKLRIARNTDIMRKHEVALVELCTLDFGDSISDNTMNVEECVSTYLKGAYNIDSNEEQDEECDINDPDADCLVDNLYSMWAEEQNKYVPIPQSEPVVEGDDSTTTSQKKVKPWSSRSSGSGTWVRDPATGEMRNIDA